ncbi:MAG: diguanylate cyclase [Ruminococcus sp.]|nr:diguanylate cyclase [Ruminococcus sp.]
MLERIRNFAFYGDTDRDNYNMIKKRIEDYNRISAMVFSILATIITFVMFLLSYRQDELSSSRIVYLLGMIFSQVLLGISLASNKKPALSYVGVYMAVSVFLIYGTAIGTFTRPNDQTVTFMVMLVFVPLLFVDRPIRMAAVLLFYVITFIILAYKYKDPRILSADITDAAIYGALSIASQSVVNRAKIRGYVLENRLHIMSETDQLTGLNNRNCYELKLSSYQKMYKHSICCIYIDVNGLHELNNTKGHKAGDEMLCYIADAVKEQFGMNDSYRVGGDEFVAFTIDTPLDKIEKLIQETNSTITDRGYHAAVGYEFCDHKNVDINDLIIRAESNMFRNKSEYYKKQDRRSRR